MMDVVLSTGRAKMLSVTTALIAVIGVSDWSIGNRASLGPFYMLPVMVAATVLRPAWIVALALGCSLLRSLFDLPSPPLEMMLRFIFAALAYAGSGLFVAALMRNHDLTVKHLERVRQEQKLRQEAEEQLALLVESSPAAILTADSAGSVLASNNAAETLFMDDALGSKPIGEYVPLLADALRLQSAPDGFRAAAQCQGRRANGEIFLAQTWFSRYMTPHGTRLAAIVVDVSEEMRDREEEGLRQLVRGNRIATAAASHEVRNLCSAISLLCANLKDKHPIADDEDFQGLAALVGGLEKLAADGLSAAANDTLEEIPLQEVMDNLRIVIEPDWREIEGSVIWSSESALPKVVAERHGLLQAFLNLAKNSHRAVQNSPKRELQVAVSVRGETVHVRFLDSGPGVADPDRLFQPLQAGADGAGLGLYLSRAVVRGYGGELCYEPQRVGTCFRVDLPRARG